MSVDTSVVTAAASDPESNGKPKMANVFDKAVVLMVEQRKLGTRRKVAAGEIETDADVDMLHISKDILKCETLDAIRQHDGKLRSYLKTRCVPSMLKSGMYLLPIDLIEEVVAKVDEWEVERKALIDAFIQEYEKVAADAEKRLGSLYNPTEYPGAETVRGAFGFKSALMSFDTPASLKRIKADLFKKESEKMAQMVSSAYDEIVQVLRAEMSLLVDHMIERLTPSADGKQKIFRNTLVDKMQDFLATFKARNIADDAQLAAVVQQARELMAGVDAEEVRSNEGIKMALGTGMQALKSMMEGMVVEKGDRQYNLED